MLAPNIADISAIHITRVPPTMPCTCLTGGATHVMVVIFASVKIHMQNILTCRETQWRFHTPKGASSVPKLLLMSSANIAVGCREFLFIGKKTKI